MSLVMTLKVPGPIAGKLFAHKGDVAPATFVMKALKHYIQYLDEQTPKEKKDEGNNFTVRIDQSHS